MADTRRIRWLAAGITIAILAALLLFLESSVPSPSPSRPTEVTRGEEFASILPIENPSREMTETSADTAESSPGADSGGGIALVVEVVNVETGKILPEARPLLHTDEKVPVPMDLYGDRFRVEDSKATLGTWNGFTFDVQLPPGYALAEARSFRIREIVSRYAQSLLVTIPAWPHVPIVVEVLDHAKRPVEGASVTQVTLSGIDRRFAAAKTDAAGLTQVVGIPALRGEEIRVTAYGDLDAWKMTTARIVDAKTPVRLTVVLPEPGSAVQIGGGHSDPFRGHRDHRSLLPHGDGTLVVRVRHRDGRPAVETLVIVSSEKGQTRFGRTDATGRVTIDRLVHGAVRVEVSEAGFASGPPLAATVAAGASNTATIVEAPPRWETVVVIGENGVGLPGARVRPILSSCYYACLENGVQRMNLLTGPDGRVRVPNIPANLVRFEASYGSKEEDQEPGPGGRTVIDFRPIAR